MLRRAENDDSTAPGRPEEGSHRVSSFGSEPSAPEQPACVGGLAACVALACMGAWASRRHADRESLWRVGLQQACCSMASWQHWQPHKPDGIHVDHPSQLLPPTPWLLAQVCCGIVICILAALAAVGSQLLQVTYASQLTPGNVTVLMIALVSLLSCRCLPGAKGVCCLVLASNATCAARQQQQRAAGALPPARMPAPPRRLCQLSCRGWEVPAPSTQPSASPWTSSAAGVTSQVGARRACCPPSPCGTSGGGQGGRPCACTRHTLPCSACPMAEAAT